MANTGNDTGHPTDPLPGTRDDDYYNSAQNGLLALKDLDKKVLDRYREALLQGSEQFTRSLQKYLLAYPATAGGGGYADRDRIAEVVQLQLDHFITLLRDSSTTKTVVRLRALALAHHELGVRPAWLVSAYLLYLNHLQTLVRTSAHIRDTHREVLDDIVTRLTFADMATLLNNYWDAAQRQRPVSQIAQEQLSSLLANIPHLLWSVDPKTNKLIYVSPNLKHISDAETETPIPCMSAVIPEFQETLMQAWQRAVDGNIAEVETQMYSSEGDMRWYRRVFYPYKSAGGEVIRIDGIMEDTTEIKQTIDRLHTLACTDNLTGLYNRNLFHNRLNHAIANARNEGGIEVALIMLDLDHFKEINDTLGHPIGDAVLKKVAQRFNETLRETDVLARLGDDEFAIITCNNNGKRAAEHVSRKLLDCFNQPYDYGQGELYLGASLGIAVYPEHGIDAATLMSRAHVAMDRSKRTGTGFLYYDAATDPNNQQRLQLAGELRNALTNNELELYYQPKINFDHGTVEGVEALIRWNHPQHGIIIPEDFIPLAERSGLIKPITDWVIRTAAMQYNSWRKAGYELCLAVNISGRVFQDPKLTERIESVLMELDAPLHGLEIEITEHELMSDIGYASQLLSKLTDLGIRVAIDDFGTGYSSLAYLKELPLHTLKIDKSFVLNMVNDENDAVIVRSMIDLAHNLGRNIVAEGIEDRDTWDLLAALGCDSAQGYFISHPLTAEDFSVWLQQSPWHPGAHQGNTV